MIISVITPFYHGNKFIKQLIQSVNATALSIGNDATVELIIVNDSPDEKVVIPPISGAAISIQLINNDKNIGIQRTRIEGLAKAKGDWVIFLDQDDELIPENYPQMIKCCKDADLVAGNLIYESNGVRKPFYQSAEVLRYSIKLRYFLTVRNMIPSPGHCLIRKEIIPQLWRESPLHNNGSDDYLLWILLLKANRRVKTVGDCVYIHHDEGDNLSLDLEKMHTSSIEMCKILRNNSVLPEQEQTQLERSIELKYLQDRGQLSVIQMIKYIDAITRILKYKLGMICCLLNKKKQ